MIFILPVIGWAVGILLCLLMAIPLYFAWNWMVPTYFYFLPEVWHVIPFWDMVWLIALVTMVKWIVIPSRFVPFDKNDWTGKK